MQQEQYPPGVPTYEDVQPSADQHTQPYQPTWRLPPEQPEPPARQPRWLLMFAFMASIVALGLAGYLFVRPAPPVDHSTARHLAALEKTVTAQGKAITRTQQDLAKAEQANAALAGKLSTAQGKLVKLRAYATNVCSTALTGPRGPANVYFPCSYNPSGG